MSIHERWERISNDGEEYLKFELVANKRSNRMDLHAFMLLDSIWPNKRVMILAAKHDEIWLDIDEEEIEQLTDDQILELSRCGVRHDDDTGSLAMFV